MYEIDNIGNPWVSNTLNTRDLEILEFSHLKKFVDDACTVEVYLAGLNEKELNEFFEEIKVDDQYLKVCLNKKYPGYFERFLKNISDLSRHQLLFMGAPELASRALKPFISWSVSIFSTVATAMTLIAAGLVTIFSGIGVSAFIGLVALSIELYAVNKENKKFFIKKNIQLLKIQVLQKINEKNFFAQLKRIADAAKVEVGESGNNPDVIFLISALKNKIYEKYTNLRNNESLEKDFENLKEEIAKKRLTNILKYSFSAQSYRDKISEISNNNKMSFIDFIKKDPGQSFKNAFANEGLIKATGIFSVATAALIVLKTLGYISAASLLISPIGLIIMSSICVACLLTIAGITFYNDYKEAQRTQESDFITAALCDVTSSAKSLLEINSATRSLADKLESAVQKEEKKSAKQKKVLPDGEMEAENMIESFLKKCKENARELILDSFKAGRQQAAVRFFSARNPRCETPNKENGKPQKLRERSFSLR